METCYLLNLGVVDYQEGLQLQEKLVELRRLGEIPDTLILLEHSPVLTFGIKARSKDAKTKVMKISFDEINIPFYDVNRGGSVVCHEPGQLVGYPVLDYSNLVKRADWKERLKYMIPRHLHYINGLEQVIIATADHYGVKTERKPSDRHSLRNVGVWYFGNGTPHKVGYTGVKILSFPNTRITMHGFAFNVNNNLSTFQLVYSCGLTDKEDGSLSMILGKELPMNEVRRTVASNFGEVFGYQLEEVELKDLLLTK